MARSVEQWERLCTSGSRTQRERNVANERCPPEVLARLAADDFDTDVARAALSNLRCPPAALSAATSNHDHMLRDAAITNPGLPAGDLARLAADADPVARRSVARNPNCDPKLLARLAADPDSWAAGNATTHPNCPVEMIVRHVMSGDSGLVAAAASNPSCPPELLARLGARHGTTPATTSGGHKRICEAVASNPSSPPDTLRSLAGLGDGLYFNEVAQNPATPPDVIADWGRLGRWDDAWIVVRREDCGGEVLADIIKHGYDYDDRTLVIAASNPNCPAEVLDRLLTADSVATFAVQSAAFTNPNCSSKTRKRAARDAFFCSRWDAENKRARLTSHKDGRAVDRKRQKTYNGEDLWRYKVDDDPIVVLSDGEEVIAAAVADPDLQTRYPQVADMARDGVTVDFNVDSRRAAGQYSPSTGVVSVRPNVKPPILLHELAHKIVDYDSRYRTPPLPAFHGAEFTAAMLDLVEVRYGAAERDALRARYKSAGAPLDKWDAPLAAEQTADSSAPLVDAAVRRFDGAARPARRCRYRLPGRRRCRNLVAAGKRRCAAGHTPAS